MVVLKCVNSADANEVKLLEFLHRTSSPDNHTIPFTTILRTQNDTVISMPYYQPLNKCRAIPAHAAANLGRQLLEAVHFMHVRGVAHRDLKPENVVVDLRAVRLFIIDYDLAMCVDGRSEMACGFVGTDGFVAPEVVDDDGGARYYSPIAADLWATGNLLGFLLRRSDARDLPELKSLQLICKLLVNDDPAQRPGADEGLARLSGHDATTLPSVGSPSTVHAEWLTRLTIPMLTVHVH